MRPQGSPRGAAVAYICLQLMNLLAPIDAAANLWDMSPLGPGLADRTPTPSSVIDSGPQRTVHRYKLPRSPSAHSPVLLVPPLAAPARCFDLRRGCSVAEHLISLGYPTYLVDYGPIAFSDRQLGLEHWVEDVIPNAVDAVRRDNGGEADVQVVGWCLGGIMSLLAVAGQDLPVSSIALIASPFDFAKVRTMAPIRQLAELTGGRRGHRLCTRRWAARRRRSCRSASSSPRSTSGSRSRSRCCATSTTARCSPTSRRSTTTWPTCSPTPAARSASSTTASSG